jgi:Ribbon-helix-helix protein, copG family
MTKPLQVYLDEQELERLNAFARDRGWTKSQAVRVAVRALTREPVDDPLLELSGDIDGLPSDLSERFDRHLRETYVAEPQGPYRARRRTTTRKTVRR